MPTKIYSDSGRNILPIKGLESSAEPESSLDISTVANMMQKQGIELKTSTSAPWRQTAAEALHRVLRLNLKRSGLTKGSKYSIPQWNYIASFMTYQINQRPLTIKYLNENLLSLSPSKMIFGMSEGYSSELSMDLGSKRLFQGLRKLETELQEWRTYWQHSYLQEMKKFNKFKQTKYPLKVGSVVLITDHLNKETGLPALGAVVEILSDRSFIVSYCKKPATLSKDMKITKSALMSTMERPAQRLVYITDMNNLREEFDVDPFGTFQGETLNASISLENNDSNEANEDLPTDADDSRGIEDIPEINESATEISVPVLAPKTKAVKIKYQNIVPNIEDIKDIKKTKKKKY